MTRTRELTRLRSAVEACFPDSLGFLRDLVQADSTLGREEGAQKIVERRLRSLGFAVRSVEPDPTRLASRDESGIPLIPYAGRRCLLGRLEGEGPRLVALNGHVDVVSEEPTEHWTRPPFEAIQEGTRLYGRGAGDMKGGIAAMLLAIEAALTLGPLSPTLLYQSVIEEECTGNGALTACLEEAVPDAAIIAEPTDGAIALAGVGVIWARITLSAPAGHAQSADRQANLIDTAYRIIGSLRQLEDRLNEDPEPEFAEFSNPYLLNIGALHAGNWPATSPGHLEMDVRLGFGIRESPAQAQELLQAAVHHVAADARVDFRGFRAHGYAFDSRSPFVRDLAASHQDVVGKPAAFSAARATCDLRYFYRPLGLAGAACYGPRAGGTHGANEWVDLDSIKQVATVLAVLLRRYSS